MSLASSTHRVPHRPSLDVPRIRRHAGRLVHPAVTIFGTLAVVASVMYFVSDAIEVVQGGFSNGQLWLTLVAEAAIPVFVVGIAFLERPALGRLGMISAFAYAYTYLYFIWTVGFALINHTKDYTTLGDDLGAVMVVHGAVMVIAGIGFGIAVLRARRLPEWTAMLFMVGVIFVAAANGLPSGAQLIAAGVRDLGFAGMGFALLRRLDSTPTPHRS